MLLPLSYLSQAEFQCSNVNLHQHVVRLLRLMVGSLKRYNQRIFLTGKYTNEQMASTVHTVFFLIEVTRPI